MSIFVNNDNSDIQDFYWVKLNFTITKKMILHDKKVSIKQMHHHTRLLSTREQNYEFSTFGIE
jgi:hypothetical protein